MAVKALPNLGKPDLLVIKKKLMLRGEIMSG